MIHVLLLTLALQPRPVAAAERLSASLRTLKISPSTIALLNLEETNDVTLRRLVTMDWWRLFDKGLSQSRAEDLRTHVRSLGLDLYLTPAELTAYRRDGVVPPISSASRVDRLQIKLVSRIALRRLGVTFIGELSGLSTERLKRAAMPARVRNEIAFAAAGLGVTLPSTARESAVARDGRLARDLVPLERLDLGAHVTRILQQRENIWNLDELKRRDRRTDLGEIRGLGVTGQTRIADVLETWGHVVSWRDPVDRMNLPPRVIALLVKRRVTTRRELRLYFERGEFARLVQNDPALLAYVRRLLDGADCGERLEVVDVEAEGQSQTGHVQ